MDKLNVVFQKYAELQKQCQGQFMKNFNSTINCYSELLADNNQQKTSFWEQLIVNAAESRSKLQNNQKAALLAFFSELPEYNTKLQEHYIKLQEDYMQHEKDSHMFNFLWYFKIDERLHSRMLADLLDPKGAHGQGQRFLVEFLRLLKIDYEKDDVWYVAAETGNVDILLKQINGTAVVVIENKSNWAVDQPNQLYRYWHQEIYTRTKSIDPQFYEANFSKYRIVYLPPNSYKYPEVHSYSRPPHEYWQNKGLPEKMPMDIEIKTFNEFVVGWLKQCLATLDKENHRMREYLTLYIEICQSL